MNELLSSHSSEIEKICRRYKVRRLDAFGSVLSETMSADSDVDFVVEFQRDGFKGAFEQFMGLKSDLETLLNRPVDLIVNRAFRNPYFQREIQQTKQPVYAA